MPEFSIVDEHAANYVGLEVRLGRPWGWMNSLRYIERIDPG